MPVRDRPRRRSPTKAPDSVDSDREKWELDPPYLLPPRSNQPKAEEEGEGGSVGQAIIQEWTDRVAMSTERPCQQSVPDSRPTGT